MQHVVVELGACGVESERQREVGMLHVWTARA
jgi:hypothetical protein